jgi:hypothetical protein
MLLSVDLTNKKPLCDLCGEIFLLLLFGFKAHQVFYLVGFLVGVDL